MNAATAAEYKELIGGIESTVAKGEKAATEAGEPGFCWSSRTCQSHPLRCPVEQSPDPWRGLVFAHLEYAPCRLDVVTDTPPRDERIR
jgi:hypothetical protein